MDFRMRLRELYVYRDNITDDIQYYNLYPKEDSE